MVAFIHVRLTSRGPPIIQNCQVHVTREVVRLECHERGPAGRVLSGRHHTDALRPPSRSRGDIG